MSYIESDAFARLFQPPGKVHYYISIDPQHVNLSDKELAWAGFDGETHHLSSGSHLSHLASLRELPAARVSRRNARRVARGNHMVTGRRDDVRFLKNALRMGEEKFQPNT